ncbi:synapse-associated protein 1-like isoform X2 [Lineus longissimus]|uniref:synapse-associated protein 1-like isoform X2 n=1 Tax=Lineus longissimus TaxID=88925 RepID=UPI002B4E262C
MLNTMSSWLGGGGTKNKDKEEPEIDSSDPKTSSESAGKASTTEPKKDEATPPPPAADPGNPDLAEGQDGADPFLGASADLQEVSKQALNTAKTWGSYLFSVGKTATMSVAQTAMHLKDKVEESTPIINEFTKEQKKFVDENREKKRQAEAAVPPWVGYNEEEQMRDQIMALSLDKRNFLRNPPSGVPFHFDFDASFPVALATLQEDPNLQKMRFELVPKAVSEEHFWRNYFYRVSLIKQSTQLTSLAQSTGNTGENASSKSSSRRSSLENGNKGDNSSNSSSDYDKLSDIQETLSAKCKGPTNGKDDVDHQEEISPGSPPDHEFVSDAFQDSNIDEEDLRKEMQQLGMNDKENDDNTDDIPEWEKELQQELQEYEVVDDGLGDDDIENEILKQLEQEAVEQS